MCECVQVSFYTQWPTKACLPDWKKKISSFFALISLPGKATYIYHTITLYEMKKGARFYYRLFSLKATGIVMNDHYHHSWNDKMKLISLFSHHHSFKVRLSFPFPCCWRTVTSAIQQQTTKQHPFIYLFQSCFQMHFILYGRRYFSYNFQLSWYFLSSQKINFYDNFHSLTHRAKGQKKQFFAQKFGVKKKKREKSWK